MNAGVHAQLPSESRISAPLGRAAGSTWQVARALLARLRGEEVPDSADDGDSKGGKR